MTYRRAEWLLALACVVALVACGYRHIADFEEPTAVTRMELRDGTNGLLWRIDSSTPRRLGFVDYGIVPEGYVQVFPAVGPPRPLRNDEHLVLVYTTPEYWRRHAGAAVGTAAFRGGQWQSGPLARTSLDKIFVETPMPIAELFRQ